MSDQKQVVSKGPTRIDRGEFEIVDHRVSTMNMTPVAADTMKAIAQAQYAVPARQTTVRHGITALVVAGGLVLMYVAPAIAWPIAALVAVLGGAAVVEQIMKRPKP